MNAEFMILFARAIATTAYMVCIYEHTRIYYRMLCAGSPLRLHKHGDYAVAAYT